jgi:hypothetical protein
MVEGIRFDVAAASRRCFRGRIAEPAELVFFARSARYHARRQS